MDVDGIHRSRLVVYVPTSLCDRARGVDRVRANVRLLALGRCQTVVIQCQREWVRDARVCALRV
jgi:hypothetical protein